jgi:CDP-glucose 4,6-dehydratase
VASSFYYGLNAMVTGCSGLIGASLCKVLLDAGAHVVGYDLERQGMLKEVGLTNDVPVIPGDILNRVALRRAFEGQDVVFHLAAISGVANARILGYYAWETNLWGTLNVLEAARATKSAVVSATTNHLYGATVSLPTPETASLDSLDTYAASKVAADVAVRSYGHTYGLVCATVRNTNCYGPYDPHLDHIIPGTITSILKHEPVTIRGDGTTSKSYLYVDDVADAYLRVAQHIVENNVHGVAFNVSCPPISVVDLVHQIIAVVGIPQNVIRCENDDGEQHDEELDWSKVQQATGWHPTTSLKDGLALTVAGFRQRMEVFA